MLKKTIVLSLLLLIVAVLAGYYIGTERCQDQSEYDYSPYCVKCYKQSAENGDAGAAYNLALFFEGRDAATSENWVRIAAERGERRAVSRVLAECGDGKQFSSQYAEKFYPMQSIKTRVPPHLMRCIFILAALVVL
jgi:TPR repeat protein